MQSFVSFPLESLAFVIINKEKKKREMCVSVLQQSLSDDD